MANQPDWAALENDFRLGTQSIRKLAVAHGVAESVVRSRAKKGGWIRACAEPAQEPIEAAHPAQLPAQTIPAPAQPAAAIPGPVEGDEPSVDPEDHGDDPVCNQKQLAKAFGGTRQTVTNWMNEGLPHWRPAHGKVNYYLSAAVAWVRDNKWSPGMDDKARQTKAQADMAEMAAAKMAGSLVDAGAAQAAWEDFLSRLKANLRGFPDRVLPRLEEGGTPMERLTICRREMDAVLRSIITEQQQQSHEVTNEQA